MFWTWFFHPEAWVKRSSTIFRFFVSLFSFVTVWYRGHARLPFSSTWTFVRVQPFLRGLNYPTRWGATIIWNLNDRYYRTFFLIWDRIQLKGLRCLGLVVLENYLNPVLGLVWDFCFLYSSYRNWNIDMMKVRDIFRIMLFWKVQIRFWISSPVSEILNIAEGFTENSNYSCTLSPIFAETTLYCY